MTRAIAMICFIAIVASATVQSQVSWQKQPDNPVVPYWSGDVDEPNGYKYALEPSVLFDNNQGYYRMWFSSLAFGSGTRGCISTAISLDGEKWFLLAKNPVLRPGGPSDFDNAFIYAADVIRIGNTYSMYYTGGDLSGRIAIGLATSTDGINWQKYSQNPVLLPGSVGTWDSHQASYAHVLFDGTTYRMWYCGNDGSSTNTGYATSQDGQQWTKHPGNPVLSRGPAGSWDAASAAPAGVEQHDSLYYLLYGGSNAQSGGNTEIGLAVSTNGITWTKHQSNPLLQRGSSGQWDDRQLGGGCLRFLNGRFAFWYTALSNAAFAWEIGMATSPLVPVSVDQRSSTAPGGYALAQSYPNPFNPRVTIQFSLPREEFVTITVFDQVGKQIATVVHEKRGRGNYSTIWDADNVASGTYWYRMVAGAFSETKKMVLLK